MEASLLGQQTAGKLKFLTHADIITSVKIFLNITSACRKGNLKIIQNSVGGCQTITSTSYRLFQAMTVSKPVIKLIVAACQGHYQHFSDGGLWISVLVSQLFSNSLELNISGPYLSEVYDKFMNFILHDISNNMNYISINIASLKQMTDFVKSVLNTKPLCRLLPSDLDYISNLLVKLFVKYMPCDGKTESWEQNINFICDHGLLASDSQLLDGLLLLGYSFPKKVLNNLQRINNQISVVMVTVSMTGDTDEVMDTEYEVFGGLSGDSAIIKRILTFCKRCIEENVRIIFCQKVIHPSIKSHLHYKNVITVDRVGRQMVPFISKLTGAVPIRTLSLSSYDGYIGYVDSVECQTINKKKYLYVRRTSSPVATVILTNDHEESVKELKTVCSSVLHSMERLAFSSKVLPGGGCWEIKTIYHLRKQVMSNISALIEEYSCSKLIIMSALNACCKSLQNLVRTLVKDSEEGKTDPIYNHFWRVPKEMVEREIICCCGIYCLKSSQLVDMDNMDINVEADTRHVQEDYNLSVMKRTIVTDQLDMCVNAVRSTFLTANSILSTHLYIC